MKSILVAKLHNGVMLPAVGLGTYKLSKDEPDAKAALSEALRMGYRHLDTARCYENEAQIGEVVREFGDHKVEEGVEAIPTKYFEAVDETTFYQNFTVPHGPLKDSRHVFVTGKAWISDFSAAKIKGYVEYHLELLGREVADLVLLHWPGDHEKFGSKETMVSPQNASTRLECWRALERELHEGRVRAIGVSNYMLKHLNPLLEDIKSRRANGDPMATIPMVNQIEISPLLHPPQELESVCRENHIQLIAYSPMGSSHGAADLLSSTLFQEVMAEHPNRTVANIILRWALQRGYVVIPKSSKIDRIKSNFQIFDFELSPEQVKLIDQANANQRFCPDPNLIE